MSSDEEVVDLEPVDDCVTKIQAAVRGRWGRCEAESRREILSEYKEAARRYGDVISKGCFQGGGANIFNEACEYTAYDAEAKGRDNVIKTLQKWIRILGGFTLSEIAQTDPDAPNRYTVVFTVNCANEKPDTVYDEVSVGDHFSVVGISRVVSSGKDLLSEQFEASSAVLAVRTKELLNTFRSCVYMKVNGNRKRTKHVGSIVQQAAAANSNQETPLTDCRLCDNLREIIKETNFHHTEVTRQLQDQIAHVQGRESVMVAKLRTTIDALRDEVSTLLSAIPEAGSNSGIGSSQALAIEHQHKLEQIAKQNQLKEEMKQKYAARQQKQRKSAPQNILVHVEVQTDSSLTYAASTLTASVQPAAKARKPSLATPQQKQLKPSSQPNVQQFSVRKRQSVSEMLPSIVAVSNGGQGQVQTPAHSQQGPSLGSNGGQGQAQARGVPQPLRKNVSEQQAAGEAAVDEPEQVDAPATPLKMPDILAKQGDKEKVVRAKRSVVFDEGEKRKAQAVPGGGRVEDARRCSTSINKADRSPDKSPPEFAIAPLNSTLSNAETNDSWMPEVQFPVLPSLSIVHVDSDVQKKIRDEKSKRTRSPPLSALLKKPYRKVLKTTKCDALRAVQARSFWEVHRLWARMDPTRQGHVPCDTILHQCFPASARLTPAAYLRFFTDPSMVTFPEFTGFYLECIAKVG